MVLRGADLNHRPSGYEPDELPDCSTPRRYKVTDDVFFYEETSSSSRLASLLVRRCYSELNHVDFARCSTPRRYKFKNINQRIYAWQRPTLTGARPQLPSAQKSLTAVFGMGTGVTSSLSPPDCFSDTSNIIPR